MSLEPVDRHPTPIPKELREQLNKFQRHLWKIKIAEALLAGFFGLILSFLFVFLLDRLVATSPLIRLVILISGTSLFAIFAPLWIRRWVHGHRREEQLARLIAKKFPKLGDRLLGVVELQDQTEASASLSPELRAAAMAHVAQQASHRNMAEALPASRHKKLALGVGATVILTIIAFFLAPKAGLNSLERWLMPFTKTERYTFTQLNLSHLPNPYPVAYGEPFQITVPLAETSDRSPAIARARYGQQEWLESSLEEGQYQFDFPKQQISDFLTLKAGDASYRIKIEPHIRPELSNLQAKVKLPAYLQLDPQTIDIRTGILSSLEGSEIQLQGEFTRPLAKALGQLTYLSDEEDESLPEPADLDITFEENKLKAAPFTMSAMRAEIPLSWTDIKGLESSSQFILRLETNEDQRPNAYIQGIERQVVILAEETLEFEILCDDDFGLKEIGLSWRGEFTKPNDSSTVKGELMLKRGSPSTARLSELALFSPKTHNIEPQKLLLSAYTEDFKPDRGRIYSKPIAVYILTRDEHAQLLKNRFDRIIGELEDAARREQNNLDINQRLNQKEGEELQADKGKSQLADSAEQEKENAKKMEEISKKMEEIFKDASRNGDIQPETMKQMAEAMQNMKELAQQDLPKAQQKLNDSQNQKNTAEKTKKDLQEAIETQKAAVQKMQETIEKANEANENFEASTFVNRLKNAASHEERIAARFISAINQQTLDEGMPESPILGAYPEKSKIDPVYFRLLQNLDTQQRRTNTDIRWIQEDLGHFYARTQKEKHQKLLNAMRDAQINIGLEKLRVKINKNQSFLSIHEAQRWAKQLREWAKELGGDSSSGGGGGGGESNESDNDFEFMLKVMRLVQQEQDIRARTRSLEQLHRSLKLQTQD